MKGHFLFRWLLLTAGAALLVSACGGGQATPTVSRPTAVPTQQATATAQVQPTATRPAPAQPTSTSAPSGQPTPTARPAATVGPTATPQPTATTAPKPTAAPEGKYGGVLKRGLPNEAPSWDTLREVGKDAQEILQPAHDQLVTINPLNQSEVIPQLAESWTTGGDNLTYTFKLHRGVTFSNGNPLTAQDVKFSYETVLNPPAGIASPIRSSLASIGSIATPDDYTVVIKLKGPDAAIIPFLGQGRASIVDKELVDKEGRDRLTKWPPVGTGPFVGKDGGWVRGVSTTVVRRPDYWVKGRPYLDSARFFIIPDEGTMFAAFLTGQINFDFTLGSAAQEQEARARMGDRLAIQTTPTSTWWSVEVNTKRAPFSDVRVRQALALAIDKYGYIKVLFDGRASIGGLLTPASGWDLPPEELLKFEGYKNDRNANVARAKQLMAEAGFPNGFKASYFTRNRRGYIESSVFAKAALQEIGITGELELVDSGKFFNELLKPDNWVMSVIGHAHPLIDPNSAYQTFYLCGVGRNYTGVCDQKMQGLFDAQNAAADPAKRKALVADLERYSLGIYNQIMLGYEKASYGYYSNIKNYMFHISLTSNRQLRDVWME